MTNRLSPLFDRVHSMKRQRTYHDFQAQDCIHSLVTSELNIVIVDPQGQAARTSGRQRRHQEADDRGSTTTGRTNFHPTPATSSVNLDNARRSAR
jgi:hypothetical protein